MHNYFKLIKFVSKSDDKLVVKEVLNKAFVIEVNLLVKKNLIYYFTWKKVINDLFIYKS